MIVRTSPGAVLARALEGGRLRNSTTAWLAASWARVARVVRPVALPPGAAVVGVGGPTLGGSYKTPLVTALARALAARGRSVAVVSHGYRGRSREPRLVRPGDAAFDVGDDALATARALSGSGVPIVTGREWAAKLSLGASLARVVIADGLLQTAPTRLSFSVLVTCAERPFGAGRCPPAGDLRASVPALLAAADQVLSVSTGAPHAPGFARERTLHTVLSLTTGRNARGEGVPLAALASVRVGLVLAVARPERVLASLAHLGIVPVETRLFLDHAVPQRFRRGGRVDVWLTSEKCATKLGPRYDGAEVLALETRLEVPEALLGAVLGRTDR